jgi:hypothetical protein
MKDNPELDFLLKVYEKIYDLFQIHYQMSERTLRFYLLIVGGLLTLTTYVFKDNITDLNSFDLSPLVVSALFLTVLTGSTLFLMQVEHRIKTIFYVHALNSLRKWFTDNASTNLAKYLILPTDKKVPPYFVVGKDFFLEIATFAVLNSSLFALTLMNLFVNDTRLPYFVYGAMWISTFASHLLAYLLAC